MTKCQFAARKTAKRYELRLASGSLNIIIGSEIEIYITDQNMQRDAVTFLSSILPYCQNPNLFFLILLTLESFLGSTHIQGEKKMEGRWNGRSGERDQKTRQSEEEERRQNYQFWRGVLIPRILGEFPLLFASILSNVWILGASTKHTHKEGERSPPFLSPFPFPNFRENLDRVYGPR